MAGLKRARESGRIGGRKKGLTDESKKKAFAALQLTVENNKMPRDKKISVSELSKVLGINRVLYYWYLDWAMKEETNGSLIKGLNRTSINILNL
jgi:DNA invertase Pin-like site-specific DNA recombinase